MNRKFFTFVTALALASQTKADDCSRAYRPGCHRPPNCSEPKDQESAPQPEGSFVTGPARGEVSGESNSLGLRLGTLRIPELSIALPTLQLPSLVKFRRNPTMHTESAEAPFVTGDVAQFGLKPRGNAESAPANPESAPAPDDRQPEGAPEEYYPQPCLPQAPCGEGCTTLFRKGADPWQNSVAHNLDAREQQMARLESQVTQMQKLIELLATQKLSESKPEPAPEPSQPPRSQRVNPWSDIEDNVESASVESDSDIVARHAEQIVQLQSKLDELVRTQQSAHTHASAERAVRVASEPEEDAAKPLIRGQELQSKTPPSREKSSIRSSTFSKLGTILSRR